MPFNPNNVVVRTTGQSMWTTLTDLHYLGPEGDWLVPAGFVTDFASIPTFVTWLIPKHGQHTLAAILHDWLIAHPVVPPRDTDRIFRRVLGELGVPPVRRALMWAGVRAAAILNPSRRAQWWRDFPAVAAISLLALPIVAPASILAIAGVAAYKAAERVAAAAGQK